IMGPGFGYVLPFFQQHKRLDIRQMTIDLPPQEVMTKDQVNLRIDGVVFYHITEPENVILNVHNHYKQLADKATSELKEVVGKMTMSEALQHRDKIAAELKAQLDSAIEDKIDKKPWGLKVRAVQINNIELPKQLVRAMAKEAEAERERKAINIRAEGEEEASTKYAEAAKKYAQSTGAMRLRELKTYEEIGKENNSFMIVIPSEMTSNANWVIPMAEAMKKQKQQPKK
ncbi:MAG: SPFH domain-containing protein, partial [archaeon]